MSFEFDESKIPDIKLNKSIVTSYDEHLVEYEANDIFFYAPADEDIEYAEKVIYAWIAWRNRLND